MNSEVTTTMNVQSTCTHPMLMTLPVASDYLYGIICMSCAKRLTIGFGDYIVEGSSKEGSKQEFCLAGLIRDNFGAAWGQTAAKQCRCTQCRGEVSRD